MTFSPWMLPGLFNPDAAGDVKVSDFVSLEVRPVVQRAGSVEAFTRGDARKPSFWSVYGRDAEGLATCIADLPNDVAADRVAEALALTYPGLALRVGELHSALAVWEEAEAAQALWEAVLDAAAATGSPELPAWQQAARRALESVGYGEVRLWMRDLARACCVAFNRAAVLEDYSDAFDWEFCPAFLASLDWGSLPGDCPTLPPVEMQAEPAEEPEPVAVIDVMDDLADVLEALATATARQLATLEDDSGDIAQGVMDAQRRAVALLARVGVKVEG